MGLAIVTTAPGSQSMSTGPTDMCKVPAPPASPIPMPFPNIALTTMAMPVTTTVLVAGMPALNKASVIEISSGDEVGVAGGVVSGKMIGPAEPTLSSVITKLEGNYAVYAGCTSTNNDGNTIGSYMATQATVMVGG